MTVTPILSIKNPLAISECVKSISTGGVVIFPTDTVYGVGCSAYISKSINKIYKIKGRDFSKALPILIGSLEQINLVSEKIDWKSEKLIATFWPGPLTIILPKHASLSPNLSPHATVGVRMPNHPWLIDLIKLSGPLATTSANPSGELAARNVNEVVHTLDGKIDLIIDGGESSLGLPSTVVDCLTDEIKILREGSISKTEILSALQ